MHRMGFLLLHAYDGNHAGLCNTCGATEGWSGGGRDACMRMREPLCTGGVVPGVLGPCASDPCPELTEPRRGLHTDSHVMAMHACMI